MLSDDMLRFVFVYDARFADALIVVPNMTASNLSNQDWYAGDARLDRFA